MRGGSVAAATALSAAAALGGLWLWTGSEGSLASALRWANALLPAGQHLQGSAVQGSLRHGGRIGQLGWQSESLSVTLDRVQLDIDLALLWQGRLPLRALHIERLQGEDLRTEQPNTRFVPWRWPLQVDTAWRIDTLHWQMGTTVLAQDLRGHYAFDGECHRLRLEHLQWSPGHDPRLDVGHYEGQLALHTLGEQPLEVDLQGLWQAPLPTAQALPSLQARLQLRGPMGGEQPRLALQASLRPLRGPGPQLDVQGELQPQAAQPLVTLQAKLQRLDLALLWPTAPHTDIDGEVRIQPLPTGWRLQTGLSNRLTGPWDRQRLPLQHLQAELLHDGQGWQLQQALARWPGGQVQGQGRWQGDRWRGDWQVSAWQASQWWSTLQGPALSGQITARQEGAASGSGAGPLWLQAQLQPRTASPSADAGDHLSLQARHERGQWTLDRLELQWMALALHASGRWQPLAQGLEGSLRWQAPGLQGHAEGFASPRQGQGQWQIDGQDMAQLQRWLARWPVPTTNLPAWLGAGALQASGQWRGGWDAEGMVLQARARPFGARWSGAQLLLGARLQHRAATHDWQGQITELDLQAAPTASATGATSTTNTTPAWRLQLDGPLAWQWQDQRLRWNKHRWQLRDAQHAAALDVQDGQWQGAHLPGARPAVQLQARVSQLPLRWAAALGLPEVAGDLLLQGGLDLDWGERPRLLAWLERGSGDLQVATEAAHQPRLQAGVRTARAQLRIDGSQAAMDLRWDSAQAGQLEARLDSRLLLNATTGLAGLWPANAPLAGQVQARLPRVGVWAWLAPPGWRVQGSLNARVEVSGTRAQPQWQGQLQADDLAVRSAVEGVAFRQGRLRARLQAQQVLLDEFELLGAGAQGGRLSAQGQVRWNPDRDRLADALDMDLQMQAHGLRVTNRADRRLSVSGLVRAQLQQGRMHLRGTLQADAAQFILTDDNTPTLGKDVVVLRGTDGQARLAAPPGLSVMGMPDVQVLLQLGPDFRLSGQGIDTRLSGEVQLSSNEASAGQPRLSGQVRTEGGRYRAYGQALDIDQGLLHFNGPYDNPALDIVALRPNLAQRVGVRVSGPALAPQVRLYADPDMPDADKLAWLVLGRSPAAGGAESAVLQQAALALLGGNGKRLGGELAVALGVDDISLANRSSTTAAGTTATGTALTLGKRLSRDFYLAYESSVSGAFGNLFIFYDLSRKLTLRAQAGEFNALDLVYTIRHD